MSTETISVYPSPPSLAAPVVFTTFFALISLLILQHIYPNAKTRKWFWILIPAAVECVGYGLKVASVKDQTDDTLYAASGTVITIAPQLSAIICFTILPTLLNATSPELSWLRAELIGPTFLGLDLLFGSLQAAGRYINLARDSDKAPHVYGQVLYAVGMWLQTVVFFVFTYFSIAFVLRFRRDSRFNGDKMLATGAMVLWTSCIAHDVRFLYRAIELPVQLRTQTDLREVYEYVFEALPMVFGIGVFVLFPYNLEAMTVHGPIDYLYAMRKQRRRGDALQDSDKAQGSGEDV